MKQNKSTKGQQLIKMLLLALLCIFASGANLSAGGYSEVGAEDNQQRVEVSLHGVNSFGAVQLFDYLLTRVPKIVTVQQTGMRLTPDEPDSCQAGWVVEVINGDAAEIIGKMRSIISDLDPERQNDILYEAPFLVMKEDLELLKKIIPVKSMHGYASFGVEGRVTEITTVTVPTDMISFTPWYARPGSGFE